MATLFKVRQTAYSFPRSMMSFDLGLPGGKPLRGEGLKLMFIKCVFVLLFGLVFGYVLQSLGFLVRAVDSFGRSSVNAGFTVDRQGVSYGE